MAKDRIDLKKKLREYRLEAGLVQAIPCSSQENQAYQKLLNDGGKLPTGVFPYIYEGGTESTCEFYTVYKPDLTEQEVAEYLAHQKLALLRTIKNCVVFFTVLTIIGILACLVLVTQ